MSDIFEVLITENPLELVFNDPSLEVLIQEDNFEVTVQDTTAEVVISNEDIEVLTIAEQGPTGVLGINISNNAPTAPSIGDLWLDLN